MSRARPARPWVDDRIHERRDDVMLLLTSAGITNGSIRTALIDLLGKPIAESHALVVSTASDPKAERWAAGMTVPSFAIDDQTAILPNEDGPGFSEGTWRRF